jgi:putative nucleotidyltransferase with HDIG domain
VAVLAIALARELALDRDTIHRIGMGAMLHDVGKVRIPDDILNKPGRLTPEELAVMRGHAAIGREILLDTPGVPEMAVRIAAEHHERLDGSGYPLGLPGTAISLHGRMAAVVDVYDAMTADPVYRRGEPPTVVLRRMLEWGGTHLDAELTRHFIRCVGIYPVGSLVRLEGGRLAVVVAAGEAGPLRPLVKTVYDTRVGRFLTPRLLNLSADGEAERISGPEDPTRWGIRVEVHLQGLPGPQPRPGPAALRKNPTAMLCFARRVEIGAKMSERTLKPLSAKQAWQMIQDNPRAVLVDIRSSMEYLFVGHPRGAVHVPWIDEPEWTVNPHFVTDIRKLMLGGAACEEEGSCAPVILICRSGKRSKEAGKALLGADFREVYHVDEGFEGDLDENHHRSSLGGWRHHGLPWEQC